MADVEKMQTALDAASDLIDLWAVKLDEADARIFDLESALARAVLLAEQLAQMIEPGAWRANQVSPSRVAKKVAECAALLPSVQSDR